MSLKTKQMLENIRQKFSINQVGAKYRNLTPGVPAGCCSPTLAVVASVLLRTFDLYLAADTAGFLEAESFSIALSAKKNQVLDTFNK